MTNHNLTYNTLTTQPVLRWHLFIKEFHPTFHCIKGEDNIVADAISHLPMKTVEEVDGIQHDVDSKHNAEVFSIKVNNE